jgi:hypothetical protein
MIKPRIFVFALLLIAFALPESIFLSSVHAIHDFRVEVKPRRISTRASYTLYLKLDKALEVHDWIKIRFPQGTKLPELSQNPERRREELKRIIESIYIGTSPCSSCQGLPEIDYAENSIRFNVHLGLDPNIEGYETIKISVTDRVGIINPDNPGWYQLSISTTRENTPVKSEAYEIVQSRIGDPKGTPKVTVTPSKSDAKAEYLIQFNVGRGGGLTMNQSRVRILFPPQTRFSFKAEDINPNRILVNGYPVSIRLMMHESMLTFISPVQVEDEAQVSIVISKEFGLLNPEKAGAYSLQVVTSEDLEWVSSDPYLIETNEPSLTVEPDIIGKNAAYQFKFLLESYEELNPDKALEILFPREVNIPQTLEAKHIVINDEICSGLWFDGDALWLQPSQIYSPGGMIQVSFLKEAGLTNPENPQEIRIGFRCFGSKAMRNTSPVQIRQIMLNWKSLELNPPNASALTEIKMTFQLGSKGGLAPNNEIILLFPEGTLIEGQALDSTLKVSFNDEILSAFFNQNQQTLRIPMLKTLEPESTHTLFLSRDLKIRNPQKDKQWVVFFISSTSEPDPVKSEDIFLPPALPETKIQILKGRQGLKSWYIEPPQISFSVSQENCTTYFWWEKQDEFAQTYSEAFFLDPGFYIIQLSYYSENAYGKEVPNSILFKVDTVMPTFMLDQPSTINSLGNQADYTFKGKLGSSQLQLHDVPTSIIDSSLLINKSPAKIDEDGSFHLKYLLSEGVNDFLITAYDEAGNYTEKQYSITLDTHPPLLEIYSPSPNENVVSSTVWIKGKTEINSSVMVDGNIIYTEEDGSFNYRYLFSEIGVKTLRIVATDPAGNITQFSLELWSGTTIKLTIGSLSYQVNQYQKNSDIEALIINSRTMVPIRLLANELQAEIQLEYEHKSKKVSKVRYILDQTTIDLYINETYAMVNQKKVSLDVAPTIIRDRTLVPLRFVAENLNALVNWDAQLMEISIKYWKPEI